MEKKLRQEIVEAKNGCLTSNEFFKKEIVLHVCFFKPLKVKCMTQSPMRYNEDIQHKCQPFASH